jgi:hypothetical protein
MDACLQPNRSRQMFPNYPEYAARFAGLGTLPGPNLGTLHQDLGTNMGTF